jgi:hypothetical protein
LAVSATEADDVFEGVRIGQAVTGRVFSRVSRSPEPADPCIAESRGSVIWYSLQDEDAAKGKVEEAD